MVERRPAENGSAVVYALTPWGAELRELIEVLIRWSAPLMVRGPGCDLFRPEWLAVALPALLEGRVDSEAAADRPPTVGVAVGGQVFQVLVTDAGMEVARHDGRPLDAVVRADPAIILGLAAGMLTLEDLRGVVDLEGDESALRAIFAP